MTTKQPQAIAKVVSSSIQELTGGTKERQTMPSVSPDSQQRTMLVKQRYGSRERFLETFSPSLQLAVGRNEERAILGEAPTLGLLKRTYGETTPTQWLMPQIWDLCEFTNSKGKLDGAQGEFLAEMIANEYGYFKVSELLLFFYRFKTGRYGRFYGTVDPMIILEALERFKAERDQVIKVNEGKQLDKQRDEWSKTAMSPQEYCKSIGFPEAKSVIEAIQLRDKALNNISSVIWLIGLLNSLFTNLYSV